MKTTERNRTKESKRLSKMAVRKGGGTQIEMRECMRGVPNDELWHPTNFVNDQLQENCNEEDGASVTDEAKRTDQDQH